MRRAVEILPQAGEAWWNLSNLKTERLNDADIATMTAALESGDATDDDRLHLHFALGKAREDSGDAKGAFAHYAEGNRIRRAQLSHEPGEVTAIAIAPTPTVRRSSPPTSGWSSRPARS